MCLNLNVVFVFCLPLFIGGIGVGCGAPTSEGFVEEAENPTPVGVGFGSPGASGGIPTGFESTGGGADSFFGEDSGTFEEDGEEDSSSFQSTAEAEEEGALAQGEGLDFGAARVQPPVARPQGQVMQANPILLAHHALLVAFDAPLPRLCDARIVVVRGEAGVADGRTVGSGRKEGSE